MQNNLNVIMVDESMSRDYKKIASGDMSVKYVQKTIVPMNLKEYSMEY